MPQEATQQARALLERYVPDLEIREIQSFDQRTTVRGECCEQPFTATLRTTRRTGAEALKGQVAIELLEVDDLDDDDHHLLLLHAPRIGPKVLEQLETFIRRHAPASLGWGAFDDQGTMRLVYPPLDLDVDQQGRDTAETARRTMRNTRAFTDLNRWLLKVLMLRDAPSKMWDGPDMSSEDIRNPADLQEVGDVSQSKAYQFARTFRDRGWLQWERGTFEVVDHRELFEHWYDDEQQLAVERHPVRSIFHRDADLEKLLEGVEATDTYAIGGFEACYLHGVLHTKRQAPELHVFEPPATAMETLDLERCPDHEAELYLVEMPYEESIRRGVCQSAQRLPVVDLLQAALDTGRHGSRGREQAEHIIENVLGW